MEVEKFLSNTIKKRAIYAFIGRGHTYQEVWTLQGHLQQKLIKAKRVGLSNHPGYLLLCEHDPVYTIGKSGKLEHLLLSTEQLSEQSFEFFKINRGGDITYHGPGQITGYPILDLDQYYNDVHRYVRDLEEMIIRVLAKWAIEGHRLEGYTGVWVRDKTQVSHKHWRKICAIGVHMSRWVSMHGFALNVNTDIEHFKMIVPCGITASNMQVTSMANELGTRVDYEAVCKEIQVRVEQVFGLTLI